MDSLELHDRTVSVKFSIKNVPDDLAERLRERARRHNRSLQGELMTILEEAVAARPLTVAEAYRRVKSLDLKTRDEATGWIRDERDGR